MSARRIVLHDGPTHPAVIPHSHRGPNLPVPPSGKPYPPPGWTLEGLGWHVRKARRARDFAVHHLARAHSDVLLDIRGREMEVEQQHAQLDARERELAQHGRAVADQVAAVRAATDAILALPWVADAVTHPIPRFDESQASP